MSTPVFRQARLAAPRPPGGEVHLEPPPELLRPPDPVQSITADLRVVLTAMAAVSGVVLVLVGRAQVVLTLVGVVLLAGAVVGALPALRRRPHALDLERFWYERYIRQMRERARETATEQRSERNWHHPPPAALWSLVGTRRMWERRREDEDFGHVRVGTGAQRLATRLVPPHTGPVEELEPLSTLALRRLVRRYSVSEDLPISVALRGFAGIGFSGDGDAVRGLVRALLCQLAVFHAPDALRIAVAAGPDAMAEWDWVKWLPHTLDPTATDGAGPARLITGSIRELERRLHDELVRRDSFTRNARPRQDDVHLVVVLDRVDAAHDFLLVPQGLDLVTVLDVSGVGLSRRRSLPLSVTPDEVEALSARGPESFGRPDSLSLAQATSLARQLAPYRVSQWEEPVVDQGRGVAFTDLVPVDVLRPGRLWALRGEQDLLRVPLGRDGEGPPVHLDLKAGTGMGPHGLLVGGGGAGKSELLRSLLLGLAMTHSPDEVNFLLVGGTAFVDLATLPQVTSVVPTTGPVDVAVLRRLGQALTGELARRRALLGDHRSVRDRERARAAGADLEPLPALLVVLDRFDTLPTDLPELTEPLLEVARTGAALGVHLLISVRRVRDDVLRGLDRFMTYRIAMRADTPEDSHAVLGSSQAFGLYPGDGVLVHGTGTTRFHAPLVSEPVVPPRRRSVVPFTGTHVPVEDTGEHRSPLEAAVAELAGRQPRARAIWTPPLDAATDLSALLGPLTTDPGTGLRADVRGVPIGQVDNVHQHRHETLALELSGHVGVVGGSGSAVLPTLVASLALTRTPREAQVYALDFGEDGALRALAGLPHVGGVATHSDAERVQRIAELVSTLLSDREDLFFRHGVDTLADLAAHEDLSHGEVFVVVDDWGRLARRHPEVADALATSAARGPRHGVHLVVAATRWADVPDRLRSVLDEVLELRLADPGTSTVDPRAAAAVPEHRPGHGLTSTGLRFVTALPRIDGRAGAEDTAVGLAALVARVKAAWSGPPAPPLRVLPDRVDAADLPADHSGRIPIGLGGNDVGPVHVDFAAAPHFLVFGDRGTGKSTLLDVIAAGLPEDARVLRWDRDTPPSTAEIRELVRELGSRTGGPAHVLLVDDYETFAPPGAASPLRPLAALLPRGAELGLHVVVARRAEGAAQARYETVLSALHGMGTPGVVLGGNPDEGAVLGAVAPRRRPPGRGELVGADGSSTVVQLARRHR